MTYKVLSSKLENVYLERSLDYIHLEFKNPVQILSSAVLNGGLVSAKHFLNLKVQENFSGTKNDFKIPEVTIKEYAEKNNWKGISVGMMTSACMKSFRCKHREIDGVIVECFLTAGVSNARRAGDIADWQSFENGLNSTGTINIVLGTNAKLSHAAMVEAIMIASEAKASVLEQYNIISPISKKIATGTGTDSTAVFCGDGKVINYCGKHVLFGEMIASVVIDALTASLSFNYIT